MCTIVCLFCPFSFVFVLSILSLTSFYFKTLTSCTRLLFSSVYLSFVRRNSNGSKSSLEYLGLYVPNLVCITHRISISICYPLIIQHVRCYYAWIIVGGGNSSLHGPTLQLSRTSACMLSLLQYWIYMGMKTLNKGEGDETIENFYWQ